MAADISMCLLGLVMSQLMILAIIIFVIYAWRFKKVPPGKAMVIWGISERARVKDPIIITGGGRFIWPVMQDYSFLSLGPWSIILELTKVPMQGLKERFHVNVSSSILVRIDSSEKALKAAAGSILGKKDNEIEEIIRIAAEKALINIIRDLDKEDITGDWIELNEMVKVEMHKDLMKMGFEVRDVVIRELYISDMKG